MKRSLLRTLIFATFLLISALSFGVDGMAGQYRVSLTSEPSIVPVGKAKLMLKVSDSQGKPVSGASIKVFARMPGMNMGEREEVAVPAADPGVYSAPASFAMAGQYDVTVSVSAPTGSGQTILQLSTGQSSLGGASSSIPWPLVLVVGAVLAFVLWRMRSTGQKFSTKGLFNKTVVLSLGLLAVALGVGTWAVRNLRREGAMTPLEAQVMEMNTPAPEGALPVTVAEVKSEPFAASVTYSGQVAGFVEQDVVPRVSGTIVAMPVYVGDTVKRGQLLARLDTSQIDPMIAEKAAAMRGAQRSVVIAEDEHHHAIEMSEQSAAQTQAADADVAEARAGLRAAMSERVKAVEELVAAKSDQMAADAELKATQAEQERMRQEFDRARSLFNRGALSLEELQAAKADSAKAEAGVESARARASRAAASIRAAQAIVESANAGIEAARSRINRAEAGKRDVLAKRRLNEVEVHSSQERIKQALDSVSAASAGLGGAETQKGYSELRAQVDGVVTQRLVSPGVVVAPGQSVLKVAQISPVRLQANVPQEDLARVKVGDPVQVGNAGKPGEILELRVSSVALAVDPTSRMGVVEAVYANPDRRFNPGQFVSMSISLGSRAAALVIPSDALVTVSHNGTTVTKVWVVAAGAPGQLNVSLRQVELHGRSTDKVAVSTGLTAGERVVVAPFGLSEGMRVQVASEPAKVVADSVTIELSGAGYSPEMVEIPAGKPTKIVFVRKVEDTCATAVDFPGIGLHAETPLNKPVTVEIPAQKAGTEITFTCPMNMYKGKVVVK